METFNPFGPPTPAQETELNRLLASRGRLEAERTRKQVRGLDAGQLENTLRYLRGEPRLPVAPAPAPPSPADAAAERLAVRARNAAAFAGRAMQPVGLNRNPFTR